jgi:hypothetical protein
MIVIVMNKSISDKYRVIHLLWWQNDPYGLRQIYEIYRFDFSKNLLSNLFQKKFFFMSRHL